MALLLKHESMIHNICNRLHAPHHSKPVIRIHAVILTQKLSYVSPMILKWRYDSSWLGYSIGSKLSTIFHSNTISAQSHCIYSTASLLYLQQMETLDLGVQPEVGNKFTSQMCFTLEVLGILHKFIRGGPLVQAQNALDFPKKGIVPKIGHLSQRQKKLLQVIIYYSWIETCCSKINGSQCVLKIILLLQCPDLCMNGTSTI